MYANNGSKEIPEKYDLKEWGPLYLDKTDLLNVVSMSDIVKKGSQIQIDTAVEDCFYLKDKKTVVSIRFPQVNGFYVQENSPGGCQGHATSAKGLTKGKNDHAQRARKFNHDLSVENVKSVRNFISNIIKNLPVSCEDMDLSEKVFGCDILTCEGKDSTKIPNIEPQ